MVFIEYTELPILCCFPRNWPFSFPFSTWLEQEWLGFLCDVVGKHRFVQGWILIQLEPSLCSPGNTQQRKREARVTAQMTDVRSDVLESLILDQSWSSVHFCRSVLRSHRKTLHSPSYFFFLRCVKIWFGLFTNENIHVSTWGKFFLFPQRDYTRTNALRLFSKSRYQCEYMVEFYRSSRNHECVAKWTFCLWKH